MRGSSVYLISLPHPIFEPAELSFSQVNRDDVPTSVYRRLVEGEDAPWIWNPPGKYTFATSRFEKNDILLFRYSGSYIFLATVLNVKKDADLVSDISTLNDRAPYAVFLKDVEKIHIEEERVRDAISYEEEIQFNGIPEVVRVEKGTWENHGAITTGISSIIGLSERRRLYEVINSLSNCSIRRPKRRNMVKDRPKRRFGDVFSKLPEKMDSKIEQFFKSFWGMYQLKLIAVPLAVLSLVSLFLLESANCAIIMLGLEPSILGSCVHFWTPSLISSATALSFSLTAFLLVGVTVLVAVDRQHLVEEYDLGQHWILEVISGENGDFTDNDPHIRVTDIVRVENGERVGSGIGANWYIVDIEGGKITVVEEPDSSDALLLGEGLYRLRRTSLNDGNNPAGSGWLVHGTCQGPMEICSQISELLNDDRQVDWMIREVEEELLTSAERRQKFRSKVGTALSYSISAAILGILIQGYPWGSEPNTTPWLSDLPAIQHIGYWASSYIFIVIFLGMVWTSIGLIELMTQLSHSNERFPNR